MIGAPALAANAALRTGCGLAAVAAPESILPFILTLAPCATGIGIPAADAPGADACAAAASTAAERIDAAREATLPWFAIGGIDAGIVHAVEQVARQRRNPDIGFGIGSGGWHFRRADWRIRRPGGGPRYLSCADHRSTGAAP